MSIFGSPRGGRLPLVLIIGIAAAVVVAIIGCFVMLRQGPDAVVRQYLLAADTQDLPTLLTLLPKAQADMLRAQLGGKMPERRSNPQAQQLEIGKAKIMGKRAYVPVKEPAALSGFAYGQPPTTETIVLVKEDRRWKVDLLATISAAEAPGGGMMPGEGGAPGLETVPPGGMEQAPPPGMESPPPPPEEGPAAGAAPSEAPVQSAPARKPAGGGKKKPSGR